MHITKQTHEMVAIGDLSFKPVCMFLSDTFLGGNTVFIMRLFCFAAQVYFYREVHVNLLQ